jgi:hypothetical protein
MSEMSKMS